MLLLTPGPVMTRPEVRAALGVDIAPWDSDFREVYAGVRHRLLRIANGVADEHVTLPLPGCGHFITEAAIRSFIPAGGRMLIPMTGSYSDRMIRLTREAGRVPVPIFRFFVRCVRCSAISKTFGRHSVPSRWK